MEAEKGQEPTKAEVVVKPLSQKVKDVLVNKKGDK